MVKRSLGNRKHATIVVQKPTCKEAHLLTMLLLFRIKFQELQEAWDQQECTSTVSVPIPASRHFEDAFIPFHDRHKPAPDRGTCPVLYVANGTVGVIHFGLSTADVKLNGRSVFCLLSGVLATESAVHSCWLRSTCMSFCSANCISCIGRQQFPCQGPLCQTVYSCLTHNMALAVACRQGKSFVGLAQSLGPHLGYLIAPALHALSAQIKSVAASNAQQQQLRRRSASCSLPPVETLTVHDSADSLSSASRQPSGAQQQPRPAQPSSRQRPAPIPPPQQQASSRMLSPFQTYTAAGVPSQPTSPDAVLRQHTASPERPGSDRLDLSPAKTALDMSMLEVARLNAGSPATGRPLIHEAVRRLSGDQLARLSANAGDVSPSANAAMRSRELELEYQPSIEVSPKGSGSFDPGRGRGKGTRRPPLPMLRASSPLSAYGSEPSGSLPRQLSIPGASGAGRFSQQAETEELQTASGTASPFAAGATPYTAQTPFAGVPSTAAAPAWQTSPSMQALGSTIPISSVLPGLSEVSQAPTTSSWQPQQSRMSPSAAASLAASLPPQLSNSAMAVLSAPMTNAMPPAPYSRGLAALAMPSVLPRSGSGMLGRSPSQQSRGMMLPASYPEAQQGRPDQPGYRLPPQLQSTSLLLQLLPAGSAQSLNQLMSRAASGASVEYDPQESLQMHRSCSLSNDNTTSVSVGSPKRSLLNMSRAVSEQLHLTSAGKGVQRPFLADLQQRWTAGHQVTSCLCTCSLPAQNISMGIELAINQIQR